MNKRARLARRILREHRQGAGYHYVLEWRNPKASVYGYWCCTHCAPDPVFPVGVPVAYR